MYWRHLVGWPALRSQYIQPTSYTVLAPGATEVIMLYLSGFE